MEMKWIVYTISLQGKVMYVGITRNFVLRKMQHLKEKGGYSAIPDDTDPSTVTFEIIKEYVYKKAALKEEDRLIVEYDTINSGWNKKRSGLIRKDDPQKYRKNYYIQNKEKIRKHNEWYKKYVLGIGM